MSLYSKFIPLILMFCIFSSCKKDFSEIRDYESETPGILITEFLNSNKSSFKDSDIKNALNSIDFESLKNSYISGYDIISADPTQKSSNEEAVLKYVFYKRDNSIVKSALVTIESDLGEKYCQQNFEKILTRNDNSFTGIIQANDILNRNLLFKLKFDNGRLIQSKTPLGRVLMDTFLNFNQTNNIDEQPYSEVCTAWYLTTTTYYSDGTSTTTEEYLYTTCISSGGGGSGGSGSDPSNPQNNINGDAHICKSSFPFNTYINTSNGFGGWQVAATTGIHMQVVDLTTGQLVPILLPTVYFGLPIIRQNGDYYSSDEAANIAAAAVQYAEGKVMEYYHSGGNIDYPGMALLFRQKMNEHMESFGGSMMLNAGSNINVTQVGQATYSWPILGCL